MIRLYASVCIEATAERVWQQLSRLEEISLWSEWISHASCESDQAQGVGAERVCQVAGNFTVTERWVEWEEGRSFQYEGFGMPLMKRATNRWSVVPYGKKSLLTSDAALELKGGVFGKLLEPLVAPLMQGIATNPLAGFKYLVEHGQPYKGNLSRLPRPPVSC